VALVVAVEAALAQGTAYDAVGTVGTLGALTQVDAAGPTLVQTAASAPTLQEVLA
jgi:hypothetical protein